MPLQFSNKPDSNKSFLQNYYDHLSFFYKSAYKTNITAPLRWILESENYPYLISVPLKPMIPFTRLHLHQAFHDRYDFVDELIAATLVPPALAIASGYLLLRSILGILSFGMIYNKSYHDPLHEFICSIIGFILTCVSLIKALISLVIRPILTLRGWEQSDERRFCTGINNASDFEINSNHEENPYYFHDGEDFDGNPVFSPFDQAERDWHLEVRPKLGFGN